MIQRIPDAPTLIEWDNDIPVLQRVMDEAQKAEVIANKYRKGNVNYTIS